LEINLNWLKVKSYEKIYTITSNPGLNISGTVEQLILKKKSYVSHEIYPPGGNGINAVIIAHRLKANLVATGFSGESNGKEIKEFLFKPKVKHRFLTISGNTRMNLTIPNRKTQKQTRLSFPVRLIKGGDGTSEKVDI
jgi:fructose-1-phosphate kinase PfkB-like protein